MDYEDVDNARAVLINVFKCFVHEKDKERELGEIDEKGILLMKLAK